MPNVIEDKEDSVDEKYYDKFGIDYENVLDFRNYETIDHLSNSSGDIAGIGRVNSSNKPVNGYDLSNFETNYGGFYQAPNNHKKEAQTSTLKVKENSILIQEDLDGEISL